MKNRVEEEVFSKALELWPRGDKLQITVNSDQVSIKVTGVLSYAMLVDLAQFFGTTNISSEGYNTGGGCDTCDFGNETGIDLVIKPEEE